MVNDMSVEKENELQKSRNVLIVEQNATATV